jgi:mannose-6-phosphate isomerase-like protein (cupin superfamily)
MPDAEASREAPESLRVFRDERGALTLADFDGLAFTPTRAYVLHDIPVGARRGGHAHRVQHRFLAVVSGTTRVVLDDGARTRTVEMRAGQSMYVPPGLWHELEALDDSLAVLVLASGAHDPDDYIRSRSELALVQPSTAAATSST